MIEHKSSKLLGDLIMEKKFWNWRNKRNRNETRKTKNTSNNN